MILKEDTIKFSFLLITILLSLTGCNKSFSPSLRDIDNILFTDCERGEAMLDSIHKETSNMSTPDWKYYQLLKLKAADKAYRPISNQKEEIDTLVSYFQHAGDKDLLAEAYFYAGRVYYEIGDKPEALKFYQKASENVAKDNYALQGDIYCQMANVYRYADLNKEALKVLKLAWKADSLSGNTRNILYDLRDIGEVFYTENKNKLAELYFCNAYNKATISKDTFMLLQLHHNLAAIYNKTNRHKLALTHIKSCLKNWNNKQQYNSGLYVTALDIYSKESDINKTNEIRNNILKFGNIYAKQYALENLLETKISSREDMQCLMVFKLYSLYSDSIFKLRNAESVKKAEMLYNYKIKENENENLKLANYIKSIIIIMIIIIALAISVCFFMKIKNYKQQQEILKLKIDKLNNLRKNSESKTTEEKKSELDIINSSSIYNIIKKQIESDTFKLSEENWNELKVLINSVYQNFDKNLETFLYTTPQEYRICILTKLGIRPTNIAKFLNVTKEAITAARRRMYQKSFKEKGSPQEWDRIIASI